MQTEGQNVAVAVALGTETKIYSGQTGSALEADNLQTASERLAAARASFSRYIVERYALRTVVGLVLPRSRCAWCGYWLIPGREYVSVRCDGQRASLVGLAVCGSVWLCPVCAAKITEYRRMELRQAVAAAQEKGLTVALLTLTMRHRDGQSLRDLLDGLKLGWKGIFQGRFAMAVKEAGLVGYIRAFEVTHGQNGWHPHLHVLLFLDRRADLDALTVTLREKWLASLKKAGYASNGHALDLRCGDSAIADYVSKWGKLSETWDVASELTKGHVKRGRSEATITPFDMLRALLGEEEGCERYVKLYREYAYSIKGVHQLQWSWHLRKLLLGQEEAPTDTEIAEKTGEYMPEVARLTVAQWRAIYNRDLVGELLAAVASSGGSYDALRGWLQAQGLPFSTWVASE